MASERLPLDRLLVEEVRVAMALNGGVSLAIWMGGCAVELDAARRAHLGPEDLGVADANAGDPGALQGFLTGKLPVAPQAPAEMRMIYCALCDAFGRELVIDLMSGASAGGINGALLACATAHERRLHPTFLRNKWLTLGDLSHLLQRTSSPDPRSLMRGKMFHAALKRTFQALVAQKEDSEADEDDVALTALPPSQSEQAAKHRADQRFEWSPPKLDVTTTDLLGVERTYRDTWGGQLVAREFRARFRFREMNDYSPENLAAAARSSASFPFAFEPWKVEAAPGALAGFPSVRWVIDGGVLDNAPIRAVLDLIPERPAERQVRRYVCYLNADPPLSDAQRAAAERRAGAVKQKDSEDPVLLVSPTLSQVAGKVLGLPSQAPFVDQLDAIARRTRQSGFARDNQLGLVGAADGVLHPVAESLLATYRRRRRLNSLDELLADPGQVPLAVVRLSDGHDLPWVPATLALPPAGEWGWGLWAAQRALHLLLDAIRASVEDAQQQGEDGLARLKSLLGVRAQLGESLIALTERRRHASEDANLRRPLATLANPESTAAGVADALRRLRTNWCSYDADAGNELRTAAALTLTVASQLTIASPSQEARALGTQLFGNPNDADAKRVDTFIRQALCIEVIRRSFNDERDVDDAQPVSFVQLTPFTEVPIFAKPGEAGPATPEEKLAGIQLGHFAAFYRSSWRANDYMWGRLDAAARIVQLLVDPRRAVQLDRQDPSHAPWARLAEGILSAEPTADQIWLVREQLPDLPASTSHKGLRDALTQKIRDDLTTADEHQRGRWTTRVCTRAVQLEILQQELAVLDETSRSDRRAGASSDPLNLPLGNGPLRPAIEELREGPTLPQRLDARGKRELGSTLGLRTTMHIAFVLLAALRSAKVPFAKPLYVLRAVLFPVAGAVSRVPWYRVVVWSGFWAASLYLTSRIVTTGSPAELGDVLSDEVLLSYIALLAVIGVIAVPFLRAIVDGKPKPRVDGQGRKIELRDDDPGGRLRRRSVEAGWALLLLTTGGGLVIVLALTKGDIGVEELIVTAKSTADPQELVTQSLVALILGLPVLRLLHPVRAAISGVLKKKRWLGPATALSFFAATVWLVVWAIGWELGELLDGDEQGWKTVAAWTAVAGAPVASGAYLAWAWLRDSKPLDAAGNFFSPDPT